MPIAKTSIFNSPYKFVLVVRITQSHIPYYQNFPIFQYNPPHFGIFSAASNEACSPYFPVYCPASFALLPPKKTLEQPCSQSYDPTSLKRETLPALAGEKVAYQICTGGRKNDAQRAIAERRFLLRIFVRGASVFPWAGRRRQILRPLSHPRSSLPDPCRCRRSRPGIPAPARR